jgi:hypothetical protein
MDDSGDGVEDEVGRSLRVELSLASARFRTLWARRDVRALDGGTVAVHHPRVGPLRLHREKLPVGDVILVVYYPDEHSDSAEKLHLLSTWDTEASECALDIDR